MVLPEIERKLAEDAKEKVTSTLLSFMMCGADAACLQADLATSVSHQLRMQYMKLNEVCYRPTRSLYHALY